MDLNHVALIGHVSMAPEQKKLESGATVTRLHVATNHAWKDKTSGEQKEKVNFHTIIAWNKLGERLARYVKKGERLYVEGRIDYRTFTGKDGLPKYVTDIVAERTIMLGKGRKASEKDVSDEENAAIDTASIDLPFVEVAV